MDWTTVIRRDIAWNDLEVFQERLVAEVKKNPSNGFLLFSEPHPTYTEGISAKNEDLLVDETALAEQGASRAKVSRGGQWTYHGPGQILIYPVVNLESVGFDKRGVARFVATFRNAIEEAVVKNGVSVRAESHPFGLYADEAKVASFGIAVTDGICRHGCALYLSDQQKRFSLIHPCGIVGEKITALNSLGWSLDWEATAYYLAETIKKRLNSRQNQIA